MVRGEVQPLKYFIDFTLIGKETIKMPSMIKWHWLIVVHKIENFQYSTAPYIACDAAQGWS